MQSYASTSIICGFKAKPTSNSASEAIVKIKIRILGHQLLADAMGQPSGQ
jgi:hypothetical protein